MLIPGIRFPFPSRRIFQSIFFSVFVIAFHKLFVVCVFEIMQIRMCIHHALNKLQFANGNIRTVIAYSLEICKNIIQNKSQLNGAFAVLKPFDMRGAVIYFVGPTPAKPGQASGSTCLAASTESETNPPIAMPTISSIAPVITLSSACAAGEKLNFFSAISRAL